MHWGLSLLADSGGERAAAIYTLVSSAKLNGLDPEAYLRHVLARIADHPSIAIAELLPWNPLRLPSPTNLLVCCKSTQHRAGRLQWSRCSNTVALIRHDLHLCGHRLPIESMLSAADYRHV